MDKKYIPYWAFFPMGAFFLCGQSFLSTWGLFSPCGGSLSPYVVGGCILGLAPLGVRRGGGVSTFKHI